MMLLNQTVPSSRKQRITCCLAHAELLGGTSPAQTLCETLLNVVRKASARGVKAEPEMRRQIAKQRRRLTTAVRLAEGDTCKNF